MKRCPQCNFLYLDADQVCDLDQTPLIADDFGTDVDVSGHSQPKAMPLSLTPTAHRRKLNLKILLAAAVAVFIISLMLLVGYQRMRPTLLASPALPTSPAQAPRVSQDAQQVSDDASARPNARPELESPVEPGDTRSALAKPTPATTSKMTPNSRPDSTRLRASTHPVSTGDASKSSRGPVTIRLADGSSLEADEVWRTKAGIWYRRKGIVTFIKPNRVRSMNH